MRYVDNDGVIVTVYHPNENQGGLLWAVKQAYSDIYNSRYVISKLFMRDFVSQFRQKLFGYFWALLLPFLGILNFLYLYFVGVLKPGSGEMPYTVYLLLGTSIWSCLPGSMGAVSGGLQAQADLIMRTRIPKMALAISSLSNILYSMLIGMVTLSVVFLLYGIWPSWCFLLYPLLVLPLLLLGTAFGLILAVLGSMAKDLPQLTSHGLSLLMYITPVVYLPGTVENAFISKLIRYNPITYLVDVPRSLVFSGKSDHVPAFFLVSFLALVGFIICLRFFYLLEDLVAERL